MNIQDILAHLEDIELQEDKTLYCTIPVHDGENSDHNSDIIDIEKGNLNHLDQRLLQAEAHVETKNKKNSEHEIKCLDDELIKSGKSVSYK